MAMAVATWSATQAMVYAKNPALLMLTALKKVIAVVHTSVSKMPFVTGETAGINQAYFSD